MDMEQRIDRVERNMESLTNIVHLLVESQIHSNARIDKLTGHVDRLTVTMQELAESHKDLDDKFSILIRMFDEWINKNPPPLGQ